MKNWILPCMLAAGGMLMTGEGAQAWQPCCGPYAESAAFPTSNPPGWFTNTYWYQWYYPWFAYYNFNHGPYANWMAGRGFATYGYPRPGVLAGVPEGVPAAVTISLPANAKLLIGGTPVPGEGALRSFPTPPLAAGQEYGYEMTAEVMKEGRTLAATKVVVVHAGEHAQVKFAEGDFKEAASAKELSPPKVLSPKEVAPPKKEDLPPKK